MSIPEAGVLTKIPEVTVTRGTPDVFRIEFLPHSGGNYTEFKRVVVSYRVTFGDYQLGNLYVAPNGVSGAVGTEVNPTTLLDAINRIAPGYTIIMLPGTYTTPINIDWHNNGNPDARKQIFAQPGVIIDTPTLSSNIFGNYWHLRGMTINGRVSVGGHHGIFELMTVRNSNNTGFQISRQDDLRNPAGYALGDINTWPSHHLILNVESYGHQDVGSTNADGFGVKLSAGFGNHFIGAIAHHNVDDGFDFYTKGTSIGAVVVDWSIAYRNGRLMHEPNHVGADGQGFKLGGEGVWVQHVVRHSIAFENKGSGFTSNSNPGVTLIDNISFDNFGGNLNLTGRGTVFRNHIISNFVSYRRLVQGENDNAQRIINGNLVSGISSTRQIWETNEASVEVALNRWSAVESDLWNAIHDLFINVPHSIYVGPAQVNGTFANDIGRCVTDEFFYSLDAPGWTTPEGVTLTQATRTNHLHAYNYKMDHSITDGSTAIIFGDFLRLTNFAAYHDRKHTVTFEVNGGEPIAAQTVFYRETISDPGTPVRGKDEFLGWYEDAEFTTSWEWDFDVDVLEEDLTIYARWEEASLDQGKIANTWFETAWAVWTGAPTDEYRAFVRLTPGYNAYYWRDGSAINVTDPAWDMAQGWVEVDPELIRFIDRDRGLWRVDIPGLPQGTYDVEIRNTANMIVAQFGTLKTHSFPRFGSAFVPGHKLISRFPAHHNAPYGATGGYLSDGRVDPSAVIMYVSHDDWDDFTRANLVQTSPFRGGNPLIVRILGTVGYVGHREDLLNQAVVELPPLLMESPNAGPNDNGRQAELLGNSHQITFEGIGNDAGIYGWGISTAPAGSQTVGSNNIVIRNLSVDGYFSFGLRAEGTSRNIWMHNNTARYGANWFLFGDGETDRSMGRGVMDVGQHVSGYTFSYNHFESGRGTHLVVGGVQNFGLNDNVHRHIGTMHHNLYDGSQERNPRTRHHNLHLFNNVYLNILGHPLHYRLSDRHIGYGQGAAHNATIWSEGNIFEAVGFPMQRSRHGHARGYYPHTGHNHFFGDGPGFMVTNDNLRLEGDSLTSIGRMPFPTFGDWGYRNTVTGLDTPLQYAALIAAVGQLQPNVMDAQTASTFDPTVDTGITVDKDATMMLPPAGDPAAGSDGDLVGFPGLHANAYHHGWGFEGDFRPHIERDQVMPTETPEQVAALRSHITTYAGRMPAFPEILSYEPTKPTNVQVNFNEFNFIMHRHNSPMDSLRTVEYPHTFTLEWDHTDTFTQAYEIQFEDNGTWRTLGFVDNDDRPKRFSTDSLHDHGYLQLSGGGHDWVATHWGGNGLSVLYPNTRIGHESHRLYTEADIPSPDDLQWTEEWVIADVVNGGTYNFRVRAVNQHGVSAWENVSYMVEANHPHIQEIVQLTEIDMDEDEGLAPGEFPKIEPGMTVQFEIVTDGLADATYEVALSVPRSLPRRELPWITRSMRNQIYLYGADLTTLPEENTQTRAEHGFSQLGNGGRDTIDIVNGRGTIDVVFDADTMPFDLLDLVLTVTVDGTDISLPFSPITGKLPILVQGIELDQDDLTLSVGENYKLTVTIDPSDADNQEVEWTTSNAEIVEVNVHGEITAIAPGVASIRVTTDCGNYYDEIEITVVAPITSLTINYDGDKADNFTLYLPNGERQLEAVVNPDYATESYEWISSNVAVATVDENGRVTAIAEGTATIYLRAVASSIGLSTTPDEIYDSVFVTVEEEAYVPVLRISVEVDEARYVNIEINHPNSEVALEEGNIIITIPNSDGVIDLENIDVTVPEGWAYDRVVEEGNIIVTVIPPAGYEVVKDGAGNLVVRPILPDIGDVDGMMPEVDPIDPETDCDSDCEETGVETPPTRPTLPETGAIVGLTLLGGFTLVASGLVMVSKKKKK
jgi:LPXTG-motif cell wall-anchored protein